MFRLAGFLVLVVLITLASATKHSVTKTHQTWEHFRTTFTKTYSTESEGLYRRQVFEQNMKLAIELERLNPMAQFGATPFADMTPSEFKRRLYSETQYVTMRNRSSMTARQAPTYSASHIENVVPASLDWRQKGAVTPVQDEGECGSPYAFSATSNIEGQWFIHKKELIPLSNQEVVSCDTLDFQCSGGLMNTVYDWFLENTGGWIKTDLSYPYVSGNGTVPPCSLEGKIDGAKITGHLFVAQDENQMMAWVAANGPLAVAVNAEQWQLYNGGVLTDCGSAKFPDHAAAIVGYVTTTNPTPYWIVKNSWGSAWGEKGYIYIAKGTNQCLITSYPTSAVVTVSPTVKPSPLPRGYVSRTICDDENCTVGCQTMVWRQGECISVDGESISLSCNANGTVTIRSYKSNTLCQGPFKIRSDVTNTCESDGFSYFDTKCPNSHDSEHFAAVTESMDKKVKKHFKSLYFSDRNLN